MSKTDRQQIKSMRDRFIRGQILYFLNMNAPERLSAEMVWKLLDMRNMSITDSELLRHVDYLHGKGYLVLEARRLSEEEIRDIRLGITPAGTDLVEGSVAPDPGVEV